MTEGEAMTSKKAAEIVRGFVGNLCEYVENVTGEDYPDGEGRSAIELIAGSEEAYAAALAYLEKAAG